MLADLYRITQDALILCGLIFLLQCAVFVYHFANGLRRGKNGITEGLLVLYVSLLFLGASVMADGVLMAPYTLVVVELGLIRVLILCGGIVGNHLLYFALKKAD